MSPISNAQFLGALFHPNETCWTTHFRENPSDANGGHWGGQSCQPGQTVDAPDRNAYFSVASFKASSTGRTKDNFSSLVVVVLDDAQKCPLVPTWLLRTSADKVQVGYCLSDPVADLGIAKRLHERLAKAGHIPLDRNGNNPVRYVRLPVGVNTKRDPPYACQLEVWQPEKTYSLSELIEGLGLDAAYILHGNSEAAPKPSATFGGAIPEGARNSTLTSLAGTMRRRGMGRESMEAALLIENASRCSPPLPESEVATIARSVAAYTPADVPSDPRSTPGSSGHGFEAPYLSALWDDKLAIDWMISGVLENKVIAEIWGPAGAYKSFTAFDMAVAITSGQEWHGHKITRQGPVLYVPGEGGRRNIVRRLKVLCQERGLGPQQIRISNMPMLLSKAEQYEFLRDEIAKFDIPPVLIIIDTLAKNFGGNENSAEDMGAFLDNLGKLSRDFEATILIIHHCGYDGTHSRGSYALHAGVDVEYQAIADKHTKTLILKNEKMKDAEEGKSFYFNIKVVGLKNESTGEVINDDEGNAITSIVLHTSSSQYAAARDAFFSKHQVFKSTRGSKIEKRLPKVLKQARFHPECSDRQMAQVVDPAVADHSWVGTMRALMLSEGLVEGEHFKLTEEGEQAAIMFDSLVQLVDVAKQIFKK
ncbi:AAA family ATPase [Pseudomonas izuensis]|uniref:AAA family ATPase n=1 Tax=Pseudomonas izuensis TaxID=2684212 RepID=UPI0013589E1E|nr:AAA family ATPase [Pseudomonas izuensis]